MQLIIINMMEDAGSCKFPGGFYLPIIGVSSDKIQLCREWITADLEHTDDDEKGQILSHSTARDFRHSLGTCDNREQFVAIFHEAWDFLSTNEYIRATFGFTLPPRFPSETTDSMSSILMAVFTLKQFLRKKQRNSIGTGSSAIYCGPVGTGKTTIMVISCVMFMLFLDDYIISVYWEFFRGGQVQWTPLELLATEVKQSVENMDELFQLVQNDLERGIVFFADEFHKLYEILPDNADEEAKKQMKWKRDVVGQIALLGKDMNCFGIAAGSSRNTAQWALHPNAFGFVGYTPLNDSVYTAVKVHPVRRKDLFMNMLQLHEFGGCSERGKLQLFLRSGGVGRALTSLRGRYVNPNDAEDIPPLPNLFYEDSALRIIISEMFLSVSDVIQSSTYDPWIHQSGLNLGRVNEIIGKFLGENLRGVKLSQYMDYSILVESQTVPGTIELLYPIMLYSVDSLCSASIDRYELMALEGVMTGWSRDSRNTSPNAGHKCEMPMLGMIASHNLLQEVPNGASIFFDKELPCLRDKFALIDPNINWHIRWFHQTFEGVDAVIFTTFDNKNFNLYYIQLKIGRVDRAINDAEMTRIFKKASSGLDKVMEMIDKRAKPNIIIKEFLLLTSIKVLTPRGVMKYKGKDIPVTTVAGGDFIEKLPTSHGLRDRIIAWQ